MIQFINLSEILREQYPELAKKLPNWVVFIIKKIIKQDKMNFYINKYKNEIGVDFTSKMISELNLKIEIEGIENLPESGRCIFVANHVFGILDGMILGNIVGKKYGSFIGIGNDAFLLIPQLASTVTSVNVYGKCDRKQLVELDKIYKSDIPINDFPAGEVSRVYKGKIQDCEWRKTFVSKAITEKREIVPVFFHGRNSILFYLVFRLRKALGIKANIELMLLPGEFFRKRNASIKITIGKSVHYSRLDGKLNHLKTALRIRNLVYSLKDNPDSLPDFN
ncbi:MAG: 1-acyl-sn-glycerol-3-phosphate acyltransferase [Bacteroidales bacterium]